MTSPFADLERLVSAEVDAMFAECTRIYPQAKGAYFAGSADWDRDAILVDGIVDFNPTDTIGQDTGRYDGMRPTIAGSRVHISYDVAQLCVLQPKPGDNIILVERPGAPQYRVSVVEEDGLGRLICVCSVG